MNPDKSSIISEIKRIIKRIIRNLKWKIQHNKKYDKRKFTIKAEIDERWVDDFCTFLYELEHNGNIGHSSLIGFYADGDGDFRPKFKIKTNYFIEKPRNKTNKECEKIYDAG